MAKNTEIQNLTYYERESDYVSPAEISPESLARIKRIGAKIAAH